jgi:hypothetical protein
VDWLRGVLPQPDVDLYLDPTRHLSEAFLGDLSRLDKKGNCVCIVMLDTYERMAGMDQWVLELVLRARERAFIVIAGRDTPSWDRDWQGWMREAYVEELLPMSTDNMRELVRKYYASIRGGEPPSTEVEAIVAFARGLPLVVTTAVTLWVKFNVARFDTVKPRVIADLVDRVMEGVPPSTRPWLEAAAVVRWFNQPLLKEVHGLELDDETYNQLWRFPFVRPHEQNLMIHDAIREVIDENCRTQNPPRHSALHAAAAAAFKKT